MDNFDELMRHKYDNDDPAGRFEFREEYWEQARALIEADETRRRKKRRWLLWWTCAGLLVVCAGLGWWQMASNRFIADGGQQMVDGKRQTADGAQIQAVDGKRQTADGGQIQTADGKRQTADGGQELTTPQQNSAIKKGNHSDIIENEGENQYNNAKNRNFKSGNSQQDLAISNQKSIELKNGHNQASATTPNNVRQQKGAENNPIGVGQTPTLAVSSPTGQPDNVLNPKTASDAALAAASLTPVGLVDSVNTSAAPNQAAAERFKKIEQLLEQLFTLPLPYPPAKLDSLNVMVAPVKVASPKMATPIKPVQDQSFVFSLSAAATAYRPTPDQHWLGFSTAAFCTRQLKGHWSVSLGLGLRYQPGNWVDSSELETTETLRYSFGYEARYSEQRNAGLFYLELPIAAVWQRGNIAFEAGVAPGYLFYALDRIKTSEETSLESRKTIQNRLQKGNTNPYGKTYVNTLVGAEWRMSPNTSLFLRGNYRLGNIVKATAETKAVRGGANAELGVKLKLF